MDKRIILGLILTLAVALLLPFYFFNEASRMEAAGLAYQAESAARGVILYKDYCAECHGANGEGEIGPALNEKRFLSKAHDAVLFDIIRDGVPNSAMPSWGQARGGPLTDQQVLDLVAFLRGWEPTAPLGKTADATPDPKRGADIYFATCIACHGKDGKGTARVPVALNDQEKLARHDNAWFFEVISKGRLDKGMPTWGKVLSPKQINDIIAHLRTWQTTAAITPAAQPTPTTQPTPTVTLVVTTTTAAPVGAVTPTLVSAAASATPTLPPATATATARPVKLAQFFPASKPSASKGEPSYTSRCVTCHGPKGDGKGSKASLLDPRPTNFTDPSKMRGENLEKLFDAVTNGVPNSDMLDFKEKIDEAGRWDVIAYVWMTFVNQPDKVTAGRAVYEQNCRACHGDAGQGDGPDAQALPTKPTDLTNAERLAALSSTELYEFISKDGDPLHSFGQKLDEDARWNVVSFVWTFVFGK
ncbi:MAG: c-type cytochrome [Chloroflexi bacterium]|nr:c-type cytochrome [Chloroflexota bacterium]